MHASISFRARGKVQWDICTERLYFIWLTFIPSCGHLETRTSSDSTDIPRYQWIVRIFFFKRGSGFSETEIMPRSFAPSRWKGSRLAPSSILCPEMEQPPLPQGPCLVRCRSRARKDKWLWGKCRQCSNTAKLQTSDQTGGRKEEGGWKREGILWSHNYWIPWGENGEIMAVFRNTD